MQLVRYGMKRGISLGISLSVLTPLVRAQEQCRPQALAVAEKFLHAEFHGVSIGGAPERLRKEARDLGFDDGEPPASPIVFVAGYRIKEAMLVGKECRITVVYKRLGTISPEELTFRLAKSEETAHIWLARDSGKWKVHMNASQYGLPPHVGSEAIKNWLRLFLQPPIDEKTVKAKRLLETVDRYR